MIRMMMMMMMMMRSWDKLIPERVAGTGLEHSEVIKLKL